MPGDQQNKQHINRASTGEGGGRMHGMHPRKARGQKKVMGREE